MLVTLNTKMVDLVLGTLSKKKWIYCCNIKHTKNRLSYVSKN